jgi:hypothetical protein
MWVLGGFEDLAATYPEDEDIGEISQLCHSEGRQVSLYVPVLKQLMNKLRLQDAPPEPALPNRFDNALSYPTFGSLDALGGSQSNSKSRSFAHVSSR